MEEKVNNDSVSSGERMRKSPNFLGFCLSIYGLANKLVDEYLKRVVTLQTTFCGALDLSRLCKRLQVLPLACIRSEIAKACRMAWKGQPQRVKAQYAKLRSLSY